MIHIEANRRHLLATIRTAALRHAERPALVIEEKVYFGGNRTQIAWDLGRLLSYPEEAIRRLIADNQEKEQL